MGEIISEANQLRDLIFKRTHLRHSALMCPREKSATTPCVARDGALASTIVDYKEFCVGCMAEVNKLLKSEEQRHF